LFFPGYLGKEVPGGNYAIVTSNLSPVPSQEGRVTNSEGHFSQHKELGKISAQQNPRGGSLARGERACHLYGKRSQSRGEIIRGVGHWLARLQHIFKHGKKAITRAKGKETRSKIQREVRNKRINAEAVLGRREERRKGNWWLIRI